ncbi:MAG TPA: Panacea domain-containing protein [Candidatus Acidoferrum sp.]|nr:Panacea domain-containing protein [Candidatus Acidoferrum sp.]
MPIIVSAQPAASLERLQHLILCIAENAPDIGITKLEKLMYLCDFAAIEKLGKSITEDRYRNFQWGPVPKHFIPAYENLLANGKLRKEQITLRSGKPFVKLTAIANCSEDDFAKEEWDIIRGVLREYGHKSAAELVRLTHEELTWKLTERNEEIPEFLAHYRDYKKPSKEEIDRLVQDPDYLASVASQMAVS